MYSYVFGVVQYHKSDYYSKITQLLLSYPRTHKSSLATEMPSFKYLEGLDVTNAGVFNPA